MKFSYRFTGFTNATRNISIEVCPSCSWKHYTRRWASMSYHNKKWSLFGTPLSAAFPSLQNEGLSSGLYVNIFQNFFILLSQCTSVSEVSRFCSHCRRCFHARLELNSHRLRPRISGVLLSPVILLSLTWVLFPFSLFWCDLDVASEILSFEQDGKPANEIFAHRSKSRYG